MQESKIFRENNCIFICGVFGNIDLPRPLAIIHQAVKDLGIEDIALDFRDCSAAFAGPMLGLCAQVLRLQAAGIQFDLHLPKEDKLARLFLNANWAHLIAPTKFKPSSFKGAKQIPATQFRSPKEQNQAVNRIANIILGAIPNIQRSDFAALEWSINEITDNVLVHSDSPIGGLVQVSTFQKVKKRIEYIVADAGLGIPKTLKDTHPDITSDSEALYRAIQQGVTRDPAVGQGNGLFGSYQICSESKGMFEIESGHAKLLYNDKSGLHTSLEPVPYNGTLVAAQIDFSAPGLLEEALKFGGQLYKPTDLVETQYEREGHEVTILLKEEAASFGSRVAGTSVRRKLENIAQMCRGKRIKVDFSDVPLISSSFADEVFGKLFLEMGPILFMQRFSFHNVPGTIRLLIDKAISQRATSGISDRRQ